MPPAATGGGGGAPGGGVSPDAHRIICFLLSSRQKHELIHSASSARAVEHWIELLARMYVHDRSARQQRRTAAALYASRCPVWQSIAAAFNFERILLLLPTPELVEEEQRVRSVWRRLMAMLVHMQQRPKRLPQRQSQRQPQRQPQQGPGATASRRRPVATAAESHATAPAATKRGPRARHRHRRRAGSKLSRSKRSK